MLRTSFVAVDNGFHFSNNDVEWQFLLPFIKGKNVCGGMCYAALDYWYSRQSPPSTRKVPPLGTELNDYLLDRQISAHLFAVPLVIGATNFKMRQDVFDNSVSEEIPKIVASLQTGRPIPLLLIRDKMLDCHFVLVTSCNVWPGGRFAEMEVYDPNQPDTTTRFWVNANTSQMMLVGDGNVTFGFYADETYDFSDPPFIPDEIVRTTVPLPLSPYIVVEGDTLPEISETFYGSDVRWADIYDANHWLVGRGPYRLKAGQVLTIPD